MTQFCGDGGVGKTQLCMQYCVHVQRPPPHGLSGRALYIDTEKNFRPERLHAMAESCLRLHPELQQTLTVEDMKSRVHIFHCNTNANDLVELIVSRVEPFIDQNPEIKLIVVDSIAQLFRYDYKGKAIERDYQLCEIGQKLRQIASLKKVAIVITNQISYNTKENKDVPSLGRLWQTYVYTNFMIKRSPVNSDRIGYTLRKMASEKHFQDILMSSILRIHSI
ncbi:unnamed protein product [Oppiella nova]|uniref:DNA repair protein RAD51 homolog 3 n=1 Tax=Oppiella nova TaxID=334625 RepID=A0A7R9LMC7_9ACAR|nr:unnamed protein product [Oppiella nova]CAG2164973.1 unnamed protein product [Oppiella nova]